ncbi:MAG: AraC-like DNA-binding protein [Halioglobus sp.]|jgi:AraC-like DNA-binding protein
MDPKFEAVELEGDSVIKTFPVNCALLQDDHGWHYHPECELTYISSGVGTRFMGDSVQHFGPGDLILAGPNLPHCWINDDDQRGDPQRNDLLVLQFKWDCLGPDFLNSPDAHALHNLFRYAQRGLKFGGDTSEDIAAALRHVHTQSGLARLTGFMHLLDLLCRSEDVEVLTSELYVSDTTDFNGGRMARVLDYVKRNLASDIKQSDVAELVAMTPQSFSRFFRATTGRTFVSFVNVMRIMEACRLLVNTEQDIIDIAFECGYANLSNFNRRFSELKQTTPREYRRQHSKIVRSRV